VNQIRILAVVIFAIFWLSPAHAKISLDPTKPISNLIKEFRAALEDLLKTAGFEAQSTVAQSINNLNVFLQNAERAYAGTIGATVKDLERIEIDAFERADTLLDNVSASLKATTDRPMASVEDLSSLLAETLAFSSKPLVTRYSPAYVSPLTHEDFVRITVGGLRLHAADFGKPKLKIGDETFYGSATDRTIVFDIPRSVFPIVKTRPANVAAELQLETTSGIWTIGRMLSKPQIVTYGLSFVVLPEVLGEYTVSGVKNVTDVIAEDFVPDPPSLRIQFGVGVDSVGHCYYAPDGLEFDLSTAKPVMVERYGAQPGGGSGRRNDAINIGKAEFDPTQALDRKRICLRVSAGTGCKGCAAVSVGKLVVKTVRTVKRTEKLQETPTALLWGSVPVEIDEAALNQSVNVSVFGLPIKRLVLDHSRAMPPFLSVEVSTNRKTATIQPIIPVQ